MTVFDHLSQTEAANSVPVEDFKTKLSYQWLLDTLFMKLKQDGKITLRLAVDNVVVVNNLIHSIEYVVACRRQPNLGFSSVFWLY